MKYKFSQTILDLKKEVKDFKSEITMTDKINMLCHLNLFHFLLQFLKPILIRFPKKYEKKNFLECWN